MEDIGAKSALDFSDEDCINAGWDTRKFIAENGITLGTACGAQSHRYDLDEENGVLYLTCTKCRWTKFLKPQAKENVRTNKRYPREIRFRSI